MPVASGAGKRKAAKPPRRGVRLEPSLLLHAAAVTFCVVAWGYLVTAAIDFGTTARGGEGQAWAFLAVACLGAAACLFAGLMFGARLLTMLGLLRGEPATDGSRAPAGMAPPRVPGGRRAKR